MEPKEIKEETVLAKLQGIADNAEMDPGCPEQDKTAVKMLVALLKDMVKGLPAAEDEDPNCQLVYWHDLRKDPTDLPDDNILVRCMVSRFGILEEHDLYCENGRWMHDCRPWGSDIPVGADTTVISWSHIPVFYDEEGDGHDD